MARSPGRRGLRGDQEGGQQRRPEAGHVQPVHEPDSRPGQQQPGHRRAHHQAELEQGLEDGVRGRHLGPLDQVRDDRPAPSVVQPAEPGRQGREDEQRPQRRPEVGVDRQARAAPGHQHLRHHQQPAAVHGVDHRSAQQRSADQREELGQRHQADVERRVGQLVHLVRHRHRGQLGAEHGHQFPEDQQAQVA
ncbi:MAG TPA: hypothetical protein VJ371_01515 [Streptosporangiaceae bacterium]|nr:hypothetical protein [Streptosporangiaceae bacterium]